MRLRTGTRFIKRIANQNTTQHKENKNMVLTQTIEHEGFDVKVQIEKGNVLIIIDDKDRDVLSEISGVSAISIFKDDDSFRVSSDYKIREI